MTWGNYEFNGDILWTALENCSKSPFVCGGTVSDGQNGAAARNGDGVRACSKMRAASGFRMSKLG